MESAIKFFWKTYFEMKAGYNRQFLHGELFRGLLVAMATTTFDLGTAS